MLPVRWRIFQRSKKPAFAGFFISGRLFGGKAGRVRIARGCVKSLQEYRESWNMLEKGLFMTARSRVGTKSVTTLRHFIAGLEF
ncbi:MAG: hypothetical protein ACI8WB_000403 [Phenylobacterium sp.]